MSQDEFARLRIRGQFGGGLIVLLGVIMMFVQQQALYFAGAFTLFWLLNYGLIHYYIGNKYVEDQTGNPKTKTIIHPH